MGAALAGMSWAGQAATAGSPTMGSSLNGAMVSRAMQRARGTAHSSFRSKRIAEDRCELAPKRALIAMRRNL
jgi:hypothetical protein